MFKRLFSIVAALLFTATMAYTDSGHTVTLASGLQYEDLVDGDGTLATPDRRVAVHYTGWLENGTQFDSSHDRGKPMVFVLGAGRVIPGWDQGIDGMKVGGKRKLIIPSSLAYGKQGVPGVIAPGATLIFEVELVGVK